MNYAGVERYSVPFFYEPNFNCQVECFPSCVSAERPARYTTTTSGKHLLSKYRQTHASYSDSSIWMEINDFQMLRFLEMKRKIAHLQINVIPLMYEYQQFLQIRRSPGVFLHDGLNFQ